MPYGCDSDAVSKYFAVFDPCLLDPCQEFCNTHVTCRSWIDSDNEGTDELQVTTGYECIVYEDNEPKADGAECGYDLVCKDAVCERSDDAGNTDPLPEKPAGAARVALVLSGLSLDDINKIRDDFEARIKQALVAGVYGLKEDQIVIIAIEEVASAGRRRLLTDAQIRVVFDILQTDDGLNPSDAATIIGRADDPGTAVYQNIQELTGVTVSSVDTDYVGFGDDDSGNDNTDVGSATRFVVGTAVGFVVAAFALLL